MNCSTKICDTMSKNKQIHENSSCLNVTISKHIKKERAQPVKIRELLGYNENSKNRNASVKKRMQPERLTKMFRSEQKISAKETYKEITGFKSAQSSQKVRRNLNSDFKTPKQMKQESKSFCTNFKEKERSVYTNLNVIDNTKKPKSNIKIHTKDIHHNNQRKSLLLPPNYIKEKYLKQHCATQKPLSNNSNQNDVITEECSNAITIPDGFNVITPVTTHPLYARSDKTGVTNNLYSQAFLINSIQQYSTNIYDQIKCRRDIILHDKNMVSMEENNSQNLDNTVNVIPVSTINEPYSLDNTKPYRREKHSSSLIHESQCSTTSKINNICSSPSISPIPIGNSYLNTDSSSTVRNVDRLKSLQHDLQNLSLKSQLKDTNCGYFTSENTKSCTDKETILLLKSHLNLMLKFNLESLNLIEKILSGDIEKNVIEKKCDEINVEKKQHLEEVEEKEENTTKNDVKLSKHTADKEIQTSTYENINLEIYKETESCNLSVNLSGQVCVDLQDNNIEAEKENNENLDPGEMKLYSNSCKTNDDSVKVNTGFYVHENCLNDSFQNLEYRLGILYKQPHKSNTCIDLLPKDLTKYKKQSLEEYMRLKSSMNFLRTPDVKRMESYLKPKIENLMVTPLNSAKIESRISAKVLSDLCTLYTDSPF